MLQSLFTTGTVSFDIYGDIVLDNNDIKIETNKYKIIIQNITEHLRTVYGDYEFSTHLGSRIKDYIGRPIDQFMIAEFENTLRKEIHNLNLIEQDDIEVLILQTDINTLHVRIVLFSDEELTIKMDISPSLGVRVGY